jgi:CRISPR/Cas system CMR-associated protein Cmr5 small subunit
MTLERTIAAKAMQLVKDRGQDSEYRSSCESLPILLRNSGLAQTLVYLKAKFPKVYSDLECQVREINLLQDRQSLCERAVDPALSMPNFRFLSEIVMLAAVWQKRMAQALIEKPKGDR